MIIILTEFKLIFSHALIYSNISVYWGPEWRDKTLNISLILREIFPDVAGNTLHTQSMAQRMMLHIKIFCSKDENALKHNENNRWLIF